MRRCLKHPDENTLQMVNWRAFSSKVIFPIYFLLRPKSTAAHPSPAMTPMTGVGAGVAGAVVGSAISQMEVPCGVLLLTNF